MVDEPRFRVKRALLLQGPMGTFFRRFASELRSGGAKVWKINFNAGDSLFYDNDEVVPFREPIEAWDAFFERFVREHAIDSVFLFGDLRPRHRIAIARARAMGVPVYVIEEGYLRPDYVTVELYGVNGDSPMSKDPEVYRRALRELPPETKPMPVGVTFRRMAWYATVYALTCTHFGFLYPHYTHHRPINAWYQMFSWLRGWWRKYVFLRREACIVPLLAGPLSKKYYFLPLQVHCDAQVQHSSYDTVEDFMEDAIRSFARLADPSLHLVVKHHPMDRAYREYGDRLAALAREVGLEGRMHYVHDIDLNHILDHAIGTITMNSTVGLSSIERGIPTKVLGRAVYDVPGMTFQGSLEDFLRDPGAVDAELVKGFRVWCRHHNQGNGHVMVALPGVRGKSGIVWPKGIDPEAR